MSFIKDTFFGGDAKRAGEIEAAGMNRGIGFINQGQQGAIGALRPVSATGDRSRHALERFLGTLGPQAQQNAFNNFIESPGQAFLRERGERAVLRNQSALGGLGGGNVLKALAQFGIGTAAQQQGDLMDRLEGLAGMGANAGANLASVFSQGAANRANLASGAGAALGAGIRGQGEGRRSGIARLAGAFI